MTLPEPKKFSEMMPEEQAIVRAVVRHPTRHDWRFVALKDSEDPIAWHVVVYSHLLYGRKGDRRWQVVASFTVEDHGDHYRVRGSGRHDRWETVLKE